MKKYQVIYKDGKWRVRVKYKWRFWKQIDYFFKEEDAIKCYDDCVKTAGGNVIKESKWL